MKPLLILRPDPGARATAERATALGLAPLIRPLFALVSCPWAAPVPADFDALVITSANTVLYAGEKLSNYAHLPVFVVGSATQAAARAAGFSDIIMGSGDAAGLFRTLARSGLKRPLHLVGQDRTPYPDLPFAITTRVVYAAVPIDADLPTIACVALLHSRRAAQRFSEICPSRAITDIVAISATVATAAGGGWASMAIAEVPSDDAMLALAAPLCKSDGNAA